MPGLLDTVFGNPDQTAALGLLGAGLMAGNPAGAFGGASQYLAGSPDRALRQRLGQAQLDNYSSEIEARKLATIKDQRQQAMMEGLFPGLLGGSPSGAPGMAGAPQMPAPAGAAPGSMPAGPNAMGGPPASGGDVSPVAQQGILALAQKLGIPPEAIKTDVLFNGGKGIADMIYKRGTPDMQVSNGFAYDKNRVGTGFMPGVNIANDGRGTMTLPGADGIPRMSAMPGSVEAYGSFEDRKNESAAGQDLVKVVGADGAERYMTKAQAIAASKAQRQPPSVAPQPGMTGAFIGDPGQAAAQIAAINNPQERANAQAAFEEQSARTPGFAQGAPFPASQTTGQVNQAAANKTFLEGRAKGANDYESSLNGRVQQGADMNLRLQEQLAALGKFRAGGGAETRAQLAQYAQSIPGMPDWVVKGVAGGDLAAMQEFNKLAAQTAMEQLKQSMGGAGRISQYEFKVFQNNNPNLSTDPNAIRKIFDFNTKIYSRDLQEQQAFNSFIKQGNDPAEFQNQWQQRQVQDGHTNPSMRAQNTEPTKPSLINELPKTAAKGARVRDTQTGDILTFNGLSWVKGK